MVLGGGLAIGACDGHDGRRHAGKPLLGIIEEVLGRCLFDGLQDPCCTVDEQRADDAGERCARCSVTEERADRHHNHDQECRDEGKRPGASGPCQR